MNEFQSISRKPYKSNATNSQIAGLRMEFQYVNGQPADIRAYDPPANRRTGNLADMATYEVYGAKVALGGRLKGSATYTENIHSLPDLVFDLDKAKVNPNKYVNLPGIGTAIPIRLKYLASTANLASRLNATNMATPSPLIAFLEMCTSISDTAATPSEKISFIQQVISDLLHKKRHADIECRS